MIALNRIIIITIIIILIHNIDLLQSPVRGWVELPGLWASHTSCCKSSSQAGRQSIDRHFIFSHRTIQSKKSSNCEEKKKQKKADVHFPSILIETQLFLITLLRHHSVQEAHVHWVSPCKLQILRHFSSFRINMKQLSNSCVHQPSVFHMYQAGNGIGLVLDWIDFSTWKALVMFLLIFVVVHRFGPCITQLSQMSPFFSPKPSFWLRC